MSLIVNPHRFGIPFTGLLDTYSGAEAAYSLRKLRAAYSGAAIRVRRSNDNAESDVSFTSSGDLDETALTAFVGANSAYVTTWYDQSGNGYDLSQTTSSQQPQIVNAGTVEKLNSKAAIKWIPDNYTVMQSTALGSAFAGEDIPICLFAVLLHQGNGSDNGGRVLIRLDSSAGGSGKAWLVRRRPDLFGDPSVIECIKAPDSGSSVYTLTTAYLNGGVRTILQILDTGTTMSNYFNGNSADPNAASYNVGYISLDRANIGANNAAGYSVWYGYTQELILFKADKSSDRTGIRDNINTYFGVY